MRKWIYCPEQSRARFDEHTGEPLTPTYSHDIRTPEGKAVALVCAFLSPESERREIGLALAAAPEALEFAKRMAEYFAQNPYGYDDLREQCHAVLRKAFPVKEVSRAS